MVEKLGIPARGMLAVLILFALFIGPVNFFVLNRMKRTIWILWTVPVLSVLTAAAVFAYATVAEGWSGRARTATLTILDQVNHRASTIGTAAFYSPLTPSGGLRFSAETEVTPQIGLTNWYYYNQGRHARSVDWTSDQHLDSGWITARVPAHFQVRKSESRRERLTVTKEANGRLRVVNGLGAAIESLWIADGDGGVWKGVNLAAGASLITDKTAEHGVSSLDPVMSGA